MLVVMLTNLGITMNTTKRSRSNLTFFVPKTCSWRENEKRKMPIDKLSHQLLIRSSFSTTQ